MNILTAWKNNKSLYPISDKIPKRILLIPATNTSVERLFSESGKIIRSRRTRLQTNKMNQLLFTCRNLSVLTQLFPTSIEAIRKRKYSIQQDTDKDISQHDHDNITFEDHNEKENNTCVNSVTVRLTTNQSLRFS